MTGSHTEDEPSSLAGRSGDERAHTSDENLIRTYLASERTFLAWLRSAVVLLGVGVGAIALGSDSDRSKEVAFSLGGVSVFTALLMVVAAYVSFGNTTTGIREGRYRPARFSVAAATLLVVVAGVVVVSLLAVEAFG